MLELGVAQRSSPMPCSMWRPPSWQSELIQSGCGSAIWRKTGRPIFIAIWWNSFLQPQVPEWPEQRSTVFTVVPGTISSASRVFWPTFCTREWQGMWYGDLAERACLKSVLRRPSFWRATRYSKGSNIASCTALHVGVVREHERQLLLEHERAGGDRRHDRVALAGELRERRDVLLLARRDRLQVAQLQLGHAAAGFLLGDHVGDLVVGEDLREVVADAGLVVVDVAGREDRDLARACGCRPSPG